MSQDETHFHSGETLKHCGILSGDGVELCQRLLIRDTAREQPAKVKAKAQIAHCRRRLAFEERLSASEEKMLRSLLAKPKTPANERYLKAAKKACRLGIKACRLGIKAWKLDIKAYRNDIATYESKIDAILKRIAEAKGGKPS